MFRTKALRNDTIPGVRRTVSDGSLRQAGFTLVEILITVNIIAIIAAIVINNYLEAVERAKLARCLAEVKGIQTAVWLASDNGNSFASAKDFWDNSPYPGTKPGPYFYLLDGDANAGHGNDLDGVDEENPGASDPDEIPIVFAIVCDHDHKSLADYVFATDDTPPQIVGGKMGGDDPGYDRFIKWENGGPGGGGGKTK